MRILLVEDDKLLGDGIQAGLMQAGFAVDWVQDGAQGATALDTGSYAAVVLDLGLPKLSGLELLRRLRAKSNAVPVLIRRRAMRSTIASRALTAARMIMW
jgi:DNA-binding response OmpR family regulator